MTDSMIDRFIAQFMEGRITRRQLMARLLLAGLSVGSVIRALASCGEEASATEVSALPIPAIARVGSERSSSRADDGVASTVEFQSPDAIAYYHPGQVDLLLQPDDPSAVSSMFPFFDPEQLPTLDSMDAAAMGDLQRHFSGEDAGVSLSQNPFQRAGGGQHHLIPLWRPGLELSGQTSNPGMYALQTVNLESWTEFLGGAEEPGDAAAGFADVALVVQGVNAYIQRLSEKGGTLRIGGWSLLEVNPSWFVHAVQCCGGGPGGRPTQASPLPGSTPQLFDPTTVQDAVRTALRAAGLTPGGPTDGAGVRVAIFDSWPANPPTYPLDAQVMDFVPPNYKGSAVTFPFNAADCFIEPPYAMSDHGYFVAQIIRDIAPKANITAYRVLNDMGTGPLHALQEAIAHATQPPIPTAIAGPTIIPPLGGGTGPLGAGPSAPPLILNLSLAIGPNPLVATQYFNSPGLPGLAASQMWAQTQCTAYASYFGGSAGTRMQLALQGLQDPHWAASKALFSTAQLGPTLAIAAAGNQSWRAHQELAAPQVPAALDGVLGVGAAGRAAIASGAGTPADYSNDNDISMSQNQGVTALGGLSEPVQIRGVGPVKITVPGTGIVALFTGPSVWDVRLGLQATPQSGWAEWGGTSFATAVVSGVAAATWSASPSATASQVMDGITKPNIVEVV